MSNHEPENGAEKCDHYARGECDPPPSFILDWAMHTTGGMGESVVASSILNQTASYLAHCEAKSCTRIVIHTEFNNNQHTYNIVMVPCSTLWHRMRKEHDPYLNPSIYPT